MDTVRPPERVDSDVAKSSAHQGECAHLDTDVRQPKRSARRARPRNATRPCQIVRCTDLGDGSSATDHRMITCRGSERLGLIVGEIGPPPPPPPPPPPTLPGC